MKLTYALFNTSKEAAAVAQTIDGSVDMIYTTDPYTGKMEWLWIVKCGEKYLRDDGFVR